MLTASALVPGSGYSGEKEMVSDRVVLNAPKLPDPRISLGSKAMLQRVALFLAVGFALFAGLGLWLNERSETRLLHTDRAPTEPTSRDIDVNAGVLRPARGGSATVRVPVIGASSKPQPQDAVTVHTDRPRTIRAREVRDDWVRIIGRFIGADSEPVSRCLDFDLQTLGEPRRVSHATE